MTRDLLGQRHSGERCSMRFRQATHAFIQGRSLHGWTSVGTYEDSCTIVADGPRFRVAIQES